MGALTEAGGSQAANGLRRRVRRARRACLGRARALRGNGWPGWLLTRIPRCARRVVAVGGNGRLGGAARLRGWERLAGLAVAVYPPALPACAASGARSSLAPGAAIQPTHEQTDGWTDRRTFRLLVQAPSEHMLRKRIQILKILPNPGISFRIWIVTSVTNPELDG